MDDSTVMSTEAIFVYYSLLLFRVATVVSSLHLELKSPRFKSRMVHSFFFLFPPRLLFNFFCNNKSFILVCGYSLKNVNDLNK